MHTINSNYFIRFGIDNLFDFRDISGGYNNGTPGRTFFAGLGIKFR
jgi:outer membrane receptor protein involved in Fe transport